jgi:hypothetical protein
VEFPPARVWQVFAIPARSVAPGYRMHAVAGNSFAGGVANRSSAIPPRRDYAGQAAVNNYPYALMEERCPIDRWRWETKRRASTLANFRDAPDAKKNLDELLLLNYDPQTQRSLGLA